MEFGFKKVSEINANNSNVAGNYGKFGLNEATLSKFDYVAYGVSVIFAAALLGLKLTGV